MLIIPAIDIKSSKVVRLFKGEYEKEKIYSIDPTQVAKYWESEGAQLIHIVDLDGALSGAPGNIASLNNIIAAIKIPIEFGGGVRTEQAAKELLDIGVSRVILGTVAFKDTTLLKKLYDRYKDKIIVSIDVGKDWAIALKGWTQKLEEQGSVNFSKTLQEIGVKQIIYTDIERDGTLQGARVYVLENYLNVLKALKINMQIIFAGGVSSLDDIKSLKKLEKQGLAGIIVGKALYEKKFTLKEAIDIT